MTWPCLTWSDPSSRIKTYITKNGSPGLDICAPCSCFYLELNRDVRVPQLKRYGERLGTVTPVPQKLIRDPNRDPDSAWVPTQQHLSSAHTMHPPSWIFSILYRYNMFLVEIYFCLFYKLCIYDEKKNNFRVYYSLYCV